MKINLTVILTSYNHERFIRESIESVLQQTYQEFEFIIVDDCSTDGSWEIICEYQKKYPSIITIRHEYNWRGGVVEDIVKNHASGDYIALHHSDDVWEKDKLEKQVEALRRTENCAAVFTNAQAIDDEGNLYADENGFYYNLFQTENRTRQEWLRYFFYNGNCLCHPSILVRKDAYMEDGFFRKGLRQIPDFVKWIQICKKYEIFVLPQPLVKFRVHAAGKNTSGMRAETQIRSTIELFLMLEEYEKITDREELLRIFPEAEEFGREEAFVPQFVLGKICTQKHLQPYTRLYGFRLLYRTLNELRTAELLKKEYGYTMQAFMDESGKYDIFGILPKKFEQERSLYFDTGSGFNEDEVIRQKYTLSEKEDFQWDCKISLDANKTLQNLRFDPAEGVLTKVYLTQITINGINTTAGPENALCTREGKEIFVNLDPIYRIILPEATTYMSEVEVVISGEIKRLTEDEINEWVSDTMYANRDMIYETQGKLQESQMLLQESQVRLQESQEELELLHSQMLEVSEELNMCGEKLDNTSEKLAECERELLCIKSTRAYKIYHKMQTVFKR